MTSSPQYLKTIDRLEAKQSLLFSIVEHLRVHYHTLLHGSVEYTILIGQSWRATVC